MMMLGALPAIEHRGAHLLRGLDEDGLCRRRRRERSRPADQDHFRSAPQRRFRQRVAHLAAGAVAEIAHRIDRLMRRSSRNQHRLARQVLRNAKALQRRGDDVLGIGQSSSADHAARQIPAVRFDDVHTALPQNFQVGARRRVLPHVHVHRRSDDHRRLGRKVQRRQKVVGDALRELGNRVGRCRRHQQRVNRLRHRDVLDRGVEVRLFRRRRRTCR